MQKRLLAAAVAGALAAPAIALAQSTVQIYGQANFQYGVLEQGRDRPNVDYFESTGTYLGFRGTEGLGGGLTAWFQCETTMDKQDTDRVIEIMMQVGNDMGKAPEYQRAMIEPIDILGVGSFTDSTVTIKARFKTQPAQQYMIGREYRRRLKKAFDVEGIELGVVPRAAATRSPVPIGAS